jgi:hypothetical protein
MILKFLVDELLAVETFSVSYFLQPKSRKWKKSFLGLLMK